MSTPIRIGAAIAGLVIAYSITPRGRMSVDEPVFEWNQIALAATVTAAQAPVQQLRSMTIVHVAMHDAISFVTRRHRTYVPYPTAPPRGSADAAAIAAAHTVLCALFPVDAARFDRARGASLSARGLSEDDAGLIVGRSAATAVLFARANDGASTAQFAYSAHGGGTPGVWVAEGTTPALLPGWGKVAPWVLRSGSQFSPEAPPALDSGRWARDYNEVKRLGAFARSERTPEQTEVARFWVAPPTVIWNGVARRIIQSRALDASDSAKALALMYLAASDAAIACWDSKYTFNFWRPQHAIRNGHLDGNDGTAGDRTWSSLFPTQPHPEYPSGHAAHSAAMATVLQLLFDDNPGEPIVANSPTNPGFSRVWKTFTEGVTEVIDARIYAGLHYRSADEEGAELGRQVARFVFTHGLR